MPEVPEAMDCRRASANDDMLWNERFAVVLAPNPALSESQQAIIAQDYEMTERACRVPVRKALLYYFQKRLRLDVADALDNPHEMPVVVANRAAFDAALRRRWHEVGRISKSSVTDGPNSPALAGSRKPMRMPIRPARSSSCGSLPRT